MAYSIHELLERCRANTGTDVRQLERDIAIDTRDWSDFIQTPSRNIDEKMLGYIGSARRPTLATAIWPEPVLSSITDAWAFAESSLPGWLPAVVPTVSDEGVLWVCTLTPPSSLARRGVVEAHPQMLHAIVGAVLLGLSSSEPATPQMETAAVQAPWWSVGTAVYATQPQVRGQGYLGFSEIEPGRGFLIAESIPNAATRSLIVAAPDLAYAVEVVLDGNQDRKLDGEEPLFPPQIEALLRRALVKARP